MNKETTKLTKTTKELSSLPPSLDCININPELLTFVCVVSQSTQVSFAIANFLANRLHSSAPRNSESLHLSNNDKNGSDDDDDIVNLDMNTTGKMMACSIEEASNRTKGCIAYANVTDQARDIRQFIRHKVSKYSVLVFYGPSDADVTSTKLKDITSSWLAVSSNTKRKKLKMLWKLWFKFPV